MTMSLAALLSMPVLAQARPEVLSGARLEEIQVRWVHTSEIFDISPLLKGGEVLLTTGLGLVGAGPDQLRAYVGGLADRDVAALCLELGRTFPAVPPALVQAARDRDLVLVALHRVVPFIDVTEAVHHVLISEELSGLRQLERVNVELTQSLLAGGGLQGLLDRIATLAGARAELVAADGRVAFSSPAPANVTSTSQAVVRRPVEVFGVEWGQLVLHGPLAVTTDAVLDRGVVAAALELVRGGRLAPARREARRELLRDIALDRVGSAAEVTARAEAVGVAPREGQSLVAVCFGLAPRTAMRAALNAVTEAGRQVLGNSLVADVEGDVLLAGRTSVRGDSELREVAARLADFVGRELTPTGGGRVSVVAAGPLVAEAVALSRSVTAAREACALVRRLGTGPRVVLSADVGVHRLLSRLLDDPELERFVEEQLGGLLEHDARRGSDLVLTLDAYLSHGLSKTRTADSLGVRRQTLYQRLERIERILAGPALNDRHRRTGLDLALLAWRLRSSAA